MMRPSRSCLRIPAPRALCDRVYAEARRRERSVAWVLRRAILRGLPEVERERSQAQVTRDNVPCVDGRWTATRSFEGMVRSWFELDGTVTFEGMEKREETKA